MDTLKMKFKLHNLEFEIEGNESVVKEQFENFKNFVTGELLSKVNIQNSQTTILPSNQKQLQTLQPTEDVILMPTGDYPDITNVVRKNLPSKEWEWVLVYAFYGSEYGQKDITRDIIKTLYTSTKRNAKQNLNNLTQNINAIHEKGYINFLNEEDFQLLETGIEEAISIINRTAGASSTNKQVKKTAIIKTSEKKQKTTSINKLETISNLNLAPDGAISLDEFYKQYPVTTHYEKILLFVHYLETVLKINETIKYNHIYTCYDWLNLPFPEAFEQTVRDLKSKKGWVEGKESIGFQTSLKGKNHFRKVISKDNNGK
jgi:hypothetical protein